MANEQIEVTVKDYEKKYIRFMGLKSFPEYKVNPVEFDMKNINDSQYFSMASTKYDFDHKRDTLSIVVFPDCDISSYGDTLFHEFTHVLDNYNYVSGNREKYCEIAGYSEYHASQIQFLYLLGIDLFTNIKPFSIKHKLINGKMVSEYVNEKRSFIKSVILRSNTTKGIKECEEIIGVLFNYFGIRSICRMYGKDYIDNDDEELSGDLFGLKIRVFNELMNGWLNDSQIMDSMYLYREHLIILLNRFYTEDNTEDNKELSKL